jgi:hypothetical protein
MNPFKYRIHSSDRSTTLQPSLLTKECGAFFLHKAGRVQKGKDGLQKPSLSFAFTA